MGKKDHQRTKGNTVSASSARSAQFLGENVGFVGFGTSTETAFVPVLVNSSDPSDDVPADMRVVLRKMHKKDLTTKIKVYILCEVSNVPCFMSRECTRRFELW